MDRNVEVRKNLVESQHESGSWGAQEDGPSSADFVCTAYTWVVGEEIELEVARSAMSAGLELAGLRSIDSWLVDSRSVGGGSFKYEMSAVSGSFAVCKRSGS